MVRAIPSARSYRAAAEILRVLGDAAAAREMERRGARLLEPAADRTAGGAARPGA
jgi:hypothetical protein